MILTEKAADQFVHYSPPACTTSSEFPLDKNELIVEAIHYLFLHRGWAGQEIEENIKGMETNRKRALISLVTIHKNYPQALDLLDDIL